MPYTQTHDRLHLCSLTPEQHARTCGYWWTVTAGALAHTAFRTEHALRTWAARVGVTLPELPPQGEPGHWSLREVYRTTLHMGLSREQFEQIPGERFRALSNGGYTLGIAEPGADGVVTVHVMNPNCKDRPVFDFWESDAVTDTGAPLLCARCGASQSPRHRHCPACGTPTGRA